MGSRDLSRVRCSLVILLDVSCLVEHGRKSAVRVLRHEAQVGEFYEKDKEMDFFKREFERLQQGGSPQVRTYGCSCFSVLLIAMAVYLLFQLFR